MGFIARLGVITLLGVSESLNLVFWSFLRWRGKQLFKFCKEK
jgi:hypothetical protein